MVIGATGRQIRSSTHPRVARAKFGMPLTPRETEVLGRMCSRDEPTGDLAAVDLGISEATLWLHMTRINRKLGTRTRLGAFRVATEIMKIELKEW